MSNERKHTATWNVEDRSYGALILILTMLTAPDGIQQYRHGARQGVSALVRRWTDDEDLRPATADEVRAGAEALISRATHFAARAAGLPSADAVRWDEAERQRTIDEIVAIALRYRRRAYPEAA